MTTLVVAAHPDDEVLGCGGTIARRARQGDDVHVVILGEGATSRHADRSDADPAVVAALADSSARAGTIMGAASVEHFGLPDNRFDTVALLDIVKLVEGAIERLAPDTVFTQHGGDLNIDHQLVFRAVLAATRPTEGHPVRSVYGFEVASSTEWAFQRFEPVFRPTVFVDIESTLAVKLEALEAYKAEVRAFPHPRSPEAIRAAAVRWGSASGLGAAEAFELVRAIR